MSFYARRKEVLQKTLFSCCMYFQMNKTGCFVAKDSYMLHYGDKDEVDSPCRLAVATEADNGSSVQPDELPNLKTKFHEIVRLTVMKCHCANWRDGIEIQYPCWRWWLFGLVQSLPTTWWVYKSIIGGLSALFCMTLKTICNWACLRSN